MRRFPSRIRNLRYGFTVVELLVAAAVLSVVMAIALGMMIESEKASRGLSGREFLLSDCQTAILTASRITQAAIAPQNFAGVANQSMLAPVFASDRIVLLAYDQQGGDALNQVTIASAEGTTLRQQPIAESAGTAPARVRETTLLGARNDDWRTSMTFSYAKAPAPGAAPDYQSSWPAGEWPDLVRIAVTARSKAPGRQPIRLTTAVIPGGLTQTPLAAPAAPAEGAKP